MIVAIPAITHALVPGPVIMNASIAPPLAPPAINALMSGIEDSVLTYIGRPIKAAKGTAKKFLALNRVTMIEVGKK